MVDNKRRKGDQPITQDEFTARIRRLWQAVLITIGFLIVGICGFAYSLREESIKRSDSIRAIAEQNTQLIEQSQKLARDGEEAHTALCLDLAQLRDEIADTEKFLRENPGNPFGIPRALFEQGLAEDREQRDLLSQTLDDC